MNIETILVPTDFSEDADEAVRVATWLAKEFGARVEVLHAYHVDVPLATPGLTAPVVLPVQFYEELRAQRT